MLPFYISGYVPDITNAFFETMSGFTSTGATVLDNIESLPHGLLFWRGMTQWIGGLGIIMFTIAVLPIFGVSGLQVFVCRRSQRPHARQGASAHRHHSQMDMEHLYQPYSDSRSPVNAGRHELVRQCVPRLRHHRNGWFLHQAGKRHYNSPYIEYVISVFMFISGINFTLLLLFVNRKFKKVIDNAELKWYFWSVAGFTAIIAVVLYYTSPMGAEEAFRKSCSRSYRCIPLPALPQTTTCCGHPCFGDC